MTNLLKSYMELILEPKPSKPWQVIRFILHWITLPVKLIVIGGLGTYQIISKSIVVKNRSVNGFNDVNVKPYFKKIWDRLPIFQSNEIKLYVNRVPYYSIPNGTNHNPDHQCSRHSTFAFLAAKLGIVDDSIDKATMMHMQGKWLARGYKYGYDGLEFNAQTTSGDMLCGLNLAVLVSNNTMIHEKFDHLIANLIENDYSLLEGQSPDSDSLAYDLYQRKLKVAGYAAERINMKSERGMWQPGLETVGAQALTVLAALRIADKKLGNREARKHYNKLLWQYGYGMLSLFPTAYTDSKRGYFNDHNCLIALYVLSKLASNRISRFFWKLPMLFVWNLSKHWYNGYFTGLLIDAHPGSVSDAYLKRCKDYLYEQEPQAFSYSNKVEGTSLSVPVTYNLNPHDEFSPDTAYNKYVVSGREEDKIKSGLGFIASAVMLESDPKKLF